MIVATGVKYLHAKAESFDIGVYFEANGHGTVLFKREKLEALYPTLKSPKAQTAYKLLINYLSMANPVVGDAMVVMLMVEASLAYLSLSIVQWSNMYGDIPSRTIKAPVKNKSIFKTTEDEQRLVAPKEVQDFIDKTCTKYESGRAFVRPSGTEDILRIHAEAATQETADKFADEIKTFLKAYA